jgi:hypothetical protein
MRLSWGQSLAQPEKGPCRCLHPERLRNSQNFSQVECGAFGSARAKAPRQREQDAANRGIAETSWLGRRYWRCAARRSLDVHRRLLALYLLFAFSAMATPATPNGGKNSTIRANWRALRGPCMQRRLWGRVASAPLMKRQPLTAARGSPAASRQLAGACRTRFRAACRTATARLATTPEKYQNR